MDLVGSDVGHHHLLYLAVRGNVPHQSPFGVWDSRPYPISVAHGQLVTPSGLH